METDAGKIGHGKELLHQHAVRAKPAGNVASEEITPFTEVLYGLPDPGVARFRKY